MTLGVYPQELCVCDGDEEKLSLHGFSDGDRLALL